jgi:uncharacterized protein YceH (UPF0502 family)
MHRFADISALQGFLDELVARSLVVELPRVPGARENRWAHLLSGAPKVDVPAANRQDVSLEALQQEVAALKALVERISKGTGIS